MKVIITSLLAITTVASGQTINNGDFNGSPSTSSLNSLAPSSWTASVGSADTFDALTTWGIGPYPASPNGGTWLHLGNNEAVSQNLMGLTIGDTYQLTVDWAVTANTLNSGGDGEIFFDLGGITQSTGVISVLPGEIGNWQTSTYSWTANATSMPFEISSSGNIGGRSSKFVDGVRFEQVPEPSSGLLSLIAAFGLLIRRRR